MPLKEMGQAPSLAERDVGLIGDVLDSWILDGADRGLMQLWISDAALDFGDK